ncbi:MAG: hypothetical protein A2252_02660 [Elusimicrobia bacterium RIFOXYA2_FULL_39_19]|nr:MAG: hypothetical protein A2252_02660 [Elusimicrobia bacterium RIFOXYA2_FULL_39_19]
MAINEEETRWLFQSLRNINFFQSFNLSNIETLVKRIEKYDYPKDKVIIKEGGEGRAFYILFKGKVQVWKKKGLFGKKMVTELGPGSFFGEMSLVTDHPCSATVIASEPIELFVLFKDTFQDQISGNPQLMDELKYIVDKRNFEQKQDN